VGQLATDENGPDRIAEHDEQQLADRDEVIDLHVKTHQEPDADEPDHKARDATGIQAIETHDGEDDCRSNRNYGNDQSSS
jgi:hypothetical protein